MARSSLASALLLISCVCSAQQPKTILRLNGSTITPVEVDATVSRLMKAAEVTGAGIAIFNRGKPAYEKAYGFRDTEKKLPLTTDSVMTAASLTKAAFATIVMQLVAEKKLGLDIPVYEYLPKPLHEYPKYADLSGDERYEKITARMLLDHTSGFPNSRFFNDDRKLNINFEPGTRFAYSGEGIDLLQFVVENITHRGLAGLMQERVFAPLGMARTSMVWQPQFESDYANGYDEYGRSLGPQKRTAADAAGGMQTTLRDYATLVSAIMQCKVLSCKMRDEMLSPQIRIHSAHEFPSLATENTTENDGIRLSYGLGWGIYFTPHGKAFFKEGHDEGWRHYVVGFANGDGLLIMTNSSNGEGIYKELLETLIASKYTPIDWEGFTPYDKLPPRPPLPRHTRVKVDPKLLDLYAGKYGVPGTDITAAITREGDHLVIQESEGGNTEPPQELDAESDNEFFSTTADDEYTFQVDSTGKVTGMVLHTGGKDIQIQRLP